MKRQIISLFTLFLFLFVTFSSNTVSAGDTSTTTIEGTNINITNGDEESGSSDTTGTQTINSTSDNSVSLDGVGSSLSSLVDTINSAGREYETGDINGDNIPDVIEFYTDRIVIFEYSTMALNYVKSLTIEKEYVLDLLKKEYQYPERIYFYSPDEKTGHGEIEISATEDASIDIDFDDIEFKDFYFIKNENSSNRGIISLNLYGKATYAGNYSTAISLGSGVGNFQCESGSWRSGATDYFGFGYRSRRGSSIVTNQGNCEKLAKDTGSNISVDNVAQLQYSVLLETTTDVEKKGVELINSTKTYMTRNTGLTPKRNIDGSDASTLDDNVQYVDDLDVNSDGLGDLIIYNDGTNTISSNIALQYEYNSSSRRYETETVGAVGSIDLGLFESDINHDSLEDAVFINAIEGTDNQNVTVYTNQDGTFVKSLDLLGVTGVEYVDLNNDANTVDNGAKDIISYVENGETYIYKVLVFNKSSKTYVSVLEGDQFTNGIGFETIDFTGDGNLDVIFKKNDGYLYFYKYTGDTSETLEYVNKVEGSDFKMLNLNGDSIKDLVTRDYIGLFQSKRFYKYNVYFYNSTTGGFELKTTNGLISAGLDTWTDNSSELEDYNSDGVKDIVSTSSTTKSLYYYNSISDRYDYLDKIKITNTLEDYVKFNGDKAVLLIDNNDLLKVYEQNASDGVYSETTKVVDRETLLNYTVSNSNTYKQYVNMGEIKLNDEANSRIYTANNGKTLHVLRNTDGKALIVNNELLGDSSAGTLFITKTTTNELTGDNKVTSIKDSITGDYEYFYSDEVLSQGFKNGISNFEQFSKSKTSEEIKGFDGDVFIYNGKTTGLSNSANNVEKSKAAYLVEKIAKRDLLDDFLIVQKYKNIDGNSSGNYFNFASFQEKVLEENENIAYNKVTRFQGFIDFDSIEEFIDNENFDYAKTNIFTYSVNGNRQDTFFETVSCYANTPKGCLNYSNSCVATDSKGRTYTLQGSSGRTCSRSNKGETVTKAISEFGGGTGYTLKILDKDGNVYNGFSFSGLSSPGETLSLESQRSNYTLFPDYNFEKPIDYKVVNDFTGIYKSFGGSDRNDPYDRLNFRQTTLDSRYFYFDFTYGGVKYPDFMTSFYFQYNSSTAVNGGNFISLYHDASYRSLTCHGGIYRRNTNGAYFNVTSCDFSSYLHYTTIDSYEN